MAPAITTTAPLLPIARPKYRAARAFYLTVFILTAFATFSLLTHDYFPAVQRSSLTARDLQPPIRPLNDDDDCRRVHKAASADQCRYIRKHCPADEGGFTAYLELYYCQLANAKPVAFIILISWLGLLFSTIGIAASDFFCIDLSTIAGLLGLSESVAGVTFLAFGNGSPDVFSTFAAMSTNSGSLAVGELFGAAGFITAVVSGSMALIRPFHVAKKSFIRDVGFFIVAAAFSMVFLWDGRLHFWECIVMVIYYIFYVIFVVGWHWWLGRKRRRREKEAAARGHFLPEEDELEADEAYHDDPEEAAQSRRPSMARGASREDWSALESAGPTPLDRNDVEDDEEEARDRWMSELASNMRLTRPTRTRKNTVTAVRPSLVGALEFQAVLKSLQKSRNIQTIPMDSRRYSDDPTFTTAQMQGNMSSTADPAARPPYEMHVTDESSPQMERPRLINPDFDSTVPGRSRARTTNDAAALRVDPRLQALSPVRSEGDLIDVAGDEDLENRRGNSPVFHVHAPDGDDQPKSPMSGPEIESRPRASTTQERRSRADSRPTSALLAPPDAQFPRHPSTDYFVPRSMSRRGTESPSEDTAQPVPSSKSLPKIIIPQRSRARSAASTRSTSSFPAYHDYPSPSPTISSRSPYSTRPPSVMLPSAQLASIASPESIDVDDSAEREVPRRPNRLERIWPYKLMPPPGVIISTLFPTVYHWGEKSWWEKLLGIVALPSVFCLTVTLPVVENDKDSDDTVSQPVTPRVDRSMDTARSKSSGAVVSASPSAFKGLSPEWMMDTSTPHPHAHEDHDEDEHESGVAGHGNTASVAVNFEQHHRTTWGSSAPNASMSAEPGAMDQSTPVEDDHPTSQLWNRWLTVIQLYTAPVFIVLSIYTQGPDDLAPSWLLLPILISLLVSTLLLIPFLLTTTPTHRPAPYRILLALAGFVVSIAWISAIASQVVGALKALAVILNMSHAIMGLTIFAVGNSLGDLVADVTVAKLGYPVMALSACFGGPMLNILLGVGLSGSYQLIRGAEERHHKHPHKGIKFRTYHIEVSKTLIVSGVTLLVTLVGLLIAVPLNRWVLDRKIGWALIVLWTVSTVFNVVIEVTGVLGGSEESLGAF